MSATAHLNMINLQVMAEDVMAADRANGTYDRNIASNEKYYLWQSQFQTRPMGMEGQPEAYAQLLRQSLPDVNTLRLPFNAFSFNADGSLDAVYERFLAEAARQGFKIVMVYADGEAQALGENGSANLSQMRAALDGSVHDRMMQSWEKMLTWLDRHPDVNAAVYALEAANEPAAYGRAETLAGGNGEFVRLYGDHMAEFAALVDGRSDARIMVGGWMYSAQFDILARTTSSDGSRSVLDQIRYAAGADLVWSAHLYPHWARAAGQEAEDIEAFILQQFGVLGNDDLVLTETNAEGDTVNDVQAGDMSFWLARAYQAFADAGIGLGWFPGAETGGASFVTINNGRYINFLHPDSYAQALNGYLLDEDDPARAAGQQISATLLRGNVYSESGTQLAVDGLGYAAGHGGNDTLTGISRAVNMLYGGRGNDVLHGTSGRDHLFGQGDNDTLYGGAGDDVLAGGDGDDVLYDGVGNDVLTGGRGADHFVLSGGTTVVTDFRHDLGDRLTLGSRAWGPEQILASGQYVDHDGDGVVDDLLLNWGDGQVVLMNHRRPDGIVHGTEAADSIAVGYKDIQGESFTREGARVQGMSGDDTIVGSTASDWLEGGAGDDSIVGGASNDTLNGDDGADTIDGGNGDDLLNGGFGNDSLMGAAGNDTLNGDDGADTIDGGNGDDLINGGTGNDSLIGWASNDMIHGDAGDDVIFGGGGNDELYGGDGDDVIDGGADNDTIFGGSGFDNLIGGAGNDTLYGNQDNDLLSGGDGNDWIHGGQGNDTLTGGTGNDTLVGGDGADTADYLSSQDGVRVDLSLIGSQVVSSSQGSDILQDIESLMGSRFSDVLTGMDGTNFLVGAGGNDLLTGMAGDDTLEGSEGNDTLYGNQDNDWIYGGDGNDWIYGGQGNDTLYGNQNNDLLSAGEGNDWIHGGQGNDTLLGEGGNDTLAGGAGDDILTGGAGADVFVFDGGRARVTDFQDDIDRIDISLRIVAEGTTIASILNNAFMNGTTAIIDLGSTGRLEIYGVNDLSQLNNDIALI